MAEAGEAGSDAEMLDAGEEDEDDEAEADETDESSGEEGDVSVPLSFCIVFTTTTHPDSQV